MRALKWIAGILGVVVLAAALVFFGNFFSKNSSNVATKSSTTKSANSSSKKGIQVTGKTDDSSYKIVIKDGKYLTSKARGITAGQESNNFNMVSFESGLLDFSKEHFNTSK